jgi:hypothetical protein
MTKLKGGGIVHCGVLGHFSDPIVLLKAEANTLWMGFFGVSELYDGQGAAMLFAFFSVPHPYYRC